MSKTGLVGLRIKAIRPFTMRELTALGVEDQQSQLPLCIEFSNGTVLFFAAYHYEGRLIMADLYKVASTDGTTYEPVYATNLTQRLYESECTCDRHDLEVVGCFCGAKEPKSEDRDA